MPTKMPNCRGKTRHATNVAKPGIRSDSIRKCIKTIFVEKKITNFHLLLLLHMGFITRYCIMKITAAIMIAASVALGI